MKEERGLNINSVGKQKTKVNEQKKPPQNLKPTPNVESEQKSGWT